MDSYPWLHYPTLSKACFINKEGENPPTDLFIGQADWAIFSIEGFYSQMTLDGSSW